MEIPSKLHQMAISEDIIEERARQEAKWGPQNHHSGEMWMTILGEEFGETCKAFLEKNFSDARDELIQVAAVAVQIIEHLDKGEVL